MNTFLQKENFMARPRKKQKSLTHTASISGLQMLNMKLYPRMPNEPDYHSPSIYAAS